MSHPYFEAVQKEPYFITGNGFLLLMTK